MFYVIKHTPTNTWVPLLSSPVERANYYYFLDGVTPKNPPFFKPSDLNFKLAFKYRTEDIANNFRKVTAQKLRNISPEKALEQFEVKGFQCWPHEELQLLDPNVRTKSVRRFTTVTVPDNWMDYSEIYCHECGFFIPPGMTYMKDHKAIICPLCVTEVFQVIKEALDHYPNKDLLETIQGQRFAEQI